MTYAMKPMPCDPSRIRGMSELLMFVATINWPAVQRVYDRLSK